MAAHKGEDDKIVKSLIPNIKGLLSALPVPDEQADQTWCEQPVNLETWLYHERYLNLSSGNIRLSQIQTEALQVMDDIDPQTCRYTEFIFEWGKGAGKDFISALAELRQVYLLLCLRNPYSYYGMAPGTGFELINVAYTQAQAKNVFFKQLVGLMKGSRWFMKRVPDIKSESIHFDWGISIFSMAADGDGAEGRNLFFAVMDEAAAFKDSASVRSMNKADGEKVKSSAEGIYDVLRTSASSRFPEVGKVVIISYPRYVDDFIQSKRKEGELLDHVYTSGPHATWDVNPRNGREKFHRDYEKNPETAAAMYECKPPFSQDGYVKVPEKMLHAAARGRSIGLFNPLSPEGYYLPEFEGTPGRFYAIHVDLALNKDRCALALACQGEPVRRLKCICGMFNFKNVLCCSTCSRPVEEWHESWLPTILFPLIRTYSRGGSRNEVSFAEVREDILTIIDRRHTIWALSYDGWQSIDSRQIMAGILGTRKVRADRWGKTFREEEIVQVLSVDRNTEAHDTLKEFLLDDRAYIHPGCNDPGYSSALDTSEDVVALAYREWRALRIIKGNKIDHPLGGSKDLVDAMAGAAWHVAKMPMRRSRQPHLAGFSTLSM